MHLVGLTAMGGAVAAPYALAADKTPTKMQISAQAAPDKHGKSGIAAAGSVTPAPPAGQRVVVKYFKRHNGKWVLRETHRPKLGSDGVYETAFYPRAKHGTCKLAGHYKGDANFDGSHAKTVFDCATGEVKQ